MGLAKRIIPVLLMKDGNLVKGEQFDPWRVVGNAYQAAEIHAARGVDELIVLDVGATPACRGPDIDAMRKLTECCFIPVAVGGGITEIWQVRELLANGADKVVIGQHAMNDPDFVFKCACKFGSQAITVALNHVDLMREHPFIVRLAQLFEEMGAGEILLNNMNRDGMLIGYNATLIKKVAEAVNVPVIAAGGAGKYQDLHKALKAGADAVAAGAMFQFTDATPKGAAEYLQKKGWEVRL